MGHEVGETTLFPRSLTLFDHEVLLCIRETPAFGVEGVSQHVTACYAEERPQAQAPLFGQNGQELLLARTLKCQSV